MYILKKYNEILGIDKNYCKEKKENSYYTYTGIENIEDLVLFIKYHLKNFYFGSLLIEDSVFWNKDKETVYFEYIVKFENGFEDIQFDEFTIQEIKNINTVLDTTKL